MKKLIRLFNIVVAIIPFAVAFFLSIFFLAGVHSWKWIGGRGNAFYGLVTPTHLPFGALMVVMLLAFCALLIWTGKVVLHRIKNSVARNIMIAAGIFLLSAALRMALIYLFQEDIVPFSDFEHSWNLAHGSYEVLDRYRTFPAYVNFSVYMRAVIRIFGDAFHNLLYLNAIYSAATAVFIFCIAKEITKNTRTGAFAALLYACMPSNILYNTIATPEFLTIFLNTFAVWLLCKSLDSAGKNRILFAIAAGLALGIGSAFKSFGIIIIVAYVMTMIVKQIIVTSKQAIRTRCKQFLPILLAIICVLGCHKAVQTGITRCSENVYQIPLSESTAVPHFFLVGLNTEGEGQIHLGTLSGLYGRKYQTNGYNLEEARKYAFTVLKEDWKNHPQDIMPLFGKKLVWAWQDDLMPLTYFLNQIGLAPNSTLEKFSYNFAENYLSAIMQIFYIVLLALGLMGSWFVIRNKSINFRVEFCLLILFGYFCLMFLSEAQSRYKCLIMPYMCIVAAIGAQQIVQFLQKKRRAV